MEKIDFQRLHPDLYRAGKRVSDLTVERATYLAVDGVGEPGAETFQAAVGQLFGLAYTAKFGLLHAGTLSYGVGRLECLWYDCPNERPRDDWRWRLMLRLPDEVTGQMLRPFRAQLMQKKGLDTEMVKRVAWREGRALQTLHRGPYERLEQTYGRLAVHAHALGVTCRGPGHEIYISDPRRTRPENLKTIVRMPVRKGR